jgi:hypothetical protein
MTHMWPNMQRKPAGPRRDMPRPEAGNDESGDEDTVFPVRFSAQAAAPSAPGPASDFPTPEGSRSASPVAVGYAPVPNDADFGPFEGGLGASEYARLDAWLDDDGEVDELEHRVSQADRFFRFVDEDELSGFDDDFGPAPNRGEPALPLDPTPLLLHLQQVRADLAHVEDEDERRRRAADEVSRVMASLGFGGGDWDDPLEEVEEDIARLDRLNEM